LSISIPLFSCLVRWHEGDSLWEVALPYYSFKQSDDEYVWSAVPNRYCVTDRLAWAVTIALTKHHEDAVLSKCQLYFVYGNDSIELNTDDAIMDVLMCYCDI